MHCIPLPTRSGCNVARTPAQVTKGVRCAHAGFPSRRPFAHLCEMRNDPYHPFCSPPRGLIYGDASKSIMCVMNPGYQVKLHMSTNCLDDSNGRVGPLLIRTALFPHPIIGALRINARFHAALRVYRRCLHSGIVVFLPLKGWGRSMWFSRFALRTIARSTTCGTPHVRSERTATIVRLCDYLINLSGERDPIPFRR
jgi:hypothetical protein